MIRAFVAVELGEALRKQIAQVQQEIKHFLSREGPKSVRVSWVQPNAIHLTIKFLGNIDEQLLVPLRDAIASAKPCHPILSIPMKRLGAFPSLQQPRVLWVGPSEQWEMGVEARQLASLHQAVEACCQSFGFTPERKAWSPHLTVARIKEGQHQLGHALAKSGVMGRLPEVGLLEVGSIVLMKSDLQPAGSVYTKLWEIRSIS